MKLKVYLAIILVFCLIPFSSFATDYEEHWAKDTIDYLVSKSVISGDLKGIRPDDAIKRSEFVKTINKNLNLKGETEVAFKDVNKDDWFYKDVAIAVANGYIKGDNNGNFNPHSYLTRAEACVALSRLMKLDAEGKESRFTDKADIPSWAVNEITAMYEKGMISGYPDGSFRAYKSMTRAEAFSIVVKSEPVLIDEKATEDLTTSEDVEIPEGTAGFVSAGGGGGGGGGGGFAPSAPSVSSKLSAPEIYRITTEGLVKWYSVSEASSYTLILKRITENSVTGERTVSSASAEYDFAAVAEELMSQDKKPLEKFTVTIRAEGNGKVSEYSKATEFYLTNDTVAIPNDIICTTQTDNQGNETIKISFSPCEHIRKYELKMDFGNGFETLIDGTQTEYIFSAGQIAKFDFSHDITFKSYSDDTDLLLDSEMITKKIDVPMFGGIDGKYNLILNERHFNNIRLKSNDKYRLSNDIVLSSGYEPFDFNGTLDGDGYSIEYNLSTTLSYAGLFSGLYAEVNVINLILKGSITNTSPNHSGTGALAGNVSSIKKGAKIEGITSYVNVSVPEGMYAGGVFGRLGDGVEAFSVSNIENNGTVSSKYYAGGIAGGSTKATIKNSRNLGSVTSANGVAGGIVGIALGNSVVESSFNTAKITSSHNVGGIVGLCQVSGSVENCFNTGEIKATSGSNNQGTAGGIMGGVNSGVTGRTMIATNCYNAGIINTNGVNPIYPSYSYTGSGDSTTYLRAVNCYYLSESKADDEKEGTTALNEAEMKDISSFDYPDSFWGMDESIPYNYPTLKENPYKVAKLKLQAPQYFSGHFNGEKVFITVKGAAETSKYAITLNNMRFESAAGGNTAEIEITDAVSAYGDYELGIVAIGDGFYYADSDVTTATYKHEPFRLKTPVISSLGYSNTNGEEYTVNWESVDKADCYDIEVYEGTSLVASSYDTANSSFTFAVAGVTSNNLTVKITSKSNEHTSSYPSEETISIAYGGGLGTEADPYLIYSKRHFENIALNSDKYFRVAADITESITSPLAEFSGNLTGWDVGAGKETIRTIDINIASDAEIYLGLFRKIDGTNARVSNLKLTGTVRNNYNSGRTGALTGYLGKATITNVINAADVIAGIGSAHAAGIAGFADNKGAIISGCGNEGNITSSYVAGGIISWSYLTSTATVEKCYNKGVVTSNNSNAGIAGGMVGIVRLVFTISDSYNTGTLNGGHKGGMVGSKDSNFAGTIILSGCYTTTPALSGDASIVSITNEAPYLNSYYLSDVTSGNGISATDMANASSFVGWDFDNIWKMDSAYPVFKNQ